MTAAEFWLAVYLAMGLGLLVVALALDGKARKRRRVFNGPWWMDDLVGLLILFFWLPGLVLAGIQHARSVSKR